MFAWFNTRQVEDFAISLAHEFAARYPPDMEASQEKKYLLKLTNTLDTLHARSRKFSAENQLGIYKKAKFGTTLKWELKELGYSDLFVDKITEKLMIGLAAG